MLCSSLSFLRTTAVGSVAINNIQKSSKRANREKLKGAAERDRLNGDRQMALESGVAFTRWAMAALLTLNSGAALAVINNELLLASPIASRLVDKFIRGAGFAVLAGGSGAVAALGLYPRFEVALGRGFYRPFGKIVTGAFVWLALLLVPTFLCGSYFAFRDGVAGYASWAASTKPVVSAPKQTSNEG